ncbi:MAG: TonB family protein [Acidobacteriaceae bacterium]
MSSQAHPAPSRPPLGSGVVGAVALHIAVVGVLIAVTFLHPSRKTPWGDKASSVGAIEASMVASIPLPPKAPPVENSVLTSENVTKAPEPPPKEKTAPPPKPTDLLIKEKVVPKIPPKVAPKETLAPPKRPQPVPVSPKATSGDAATQLPQSISHVKDGTATVTVQNRAFGNRYAYYLRIVGSKVTENYYLQEPDPIASRGKSVTVLFDIQRDGSPANLRIETRSGSPSLDNAALRAIQRIDTFGDLPEGDHITIEYKFDYRP